MPKVSIIMPLYQVAAYLSRAVASVEQQTFSNWELLLVDDASRDGTSALAASCAAQDDRIRLLTHAVNQGVSAARNTGLEAAQGEYVAFIDPDDAVAPDFLQEMVAFAEAERLELVISGFVREAGARISYPLAPLPRMVMDTRTAYREMVSMHHFNWSPCDKLFLRERLRGEGVCFATDIRIGEDLDFCWRYLRSCHRVGFVPLYAYHYCQHAASVTHRARTDVRLDSVRVMRRCLVEARDRDDVTAARLEELYAKELASCIKDLLYQSAYGADVRAMQRELRRSLGAVLRNRDFSFFIKCAMLFFLLPYPLVYGVWKVLERPAQWLRSLLMARQSKRQAAMIGENHAEVSLEYKQRSGGARRRAAPRCQKRRGRV